MLDEKKKYEIGNRIRDFRILNRFTQAEFAESIDISINFLSEIENGKKGMSYETLYSLCKNHSVSADYILFGEPTKDDDYTVIVEIANRLDNVQLSKLINYLNALSDLRSM